VAAVRNTPLTDDQIVRARDYLQRELDRASEDNVNLLNLLLRRYESGEVPNRDVVSEQAADIMALTGAAVTQAAMKYLDPARYVRVTLMPGRGQ
jgi:predicted Zn-dependent peptidase